MSTQPVLSSSARFAACVKSPSSIPTRPPTTSKQPRRHVLEMVRKGLIPGHPLDPHAKKKDWRFLLSRTRTCTC